jgi:hypothetical protein
MSGGLTEKEMPVAEHMQQSIPCMDENKGGGP